jgi:hypothetical protein
MPSEVEPMFEESVLKTIYQHVSAIRLCLRSGLQLPALILVYVGIDAFGALGRPLGQKRKTGKDFIAWADRYMVKPSSLSVTAVELYGARCGLLHTLGSDSNLSDAGKMRPVVYSWGDRNVGPANSLLEQIELPGVVAKIENIADAFVEGIALFGQEVDATPKLEDEVSSRARKMFGQFPHFPGTPGFEA